MTNKLYTGPPPGWESIPELFERFTNTGSAFCGVVLQSNLHVECWGYFIGVRITSEDVAANRGSCSIGQYSKKKS
jgi:hypothetical protein